VKALLPIILPVIAGELAAWQIRKRLI